MSEMWNRFSAVYAYYPTYECPTCYIKRIIRTREDLSTIIYELRARYPDYEDYLLYLI